MTKFCVRVQLLEVLANETKCIAPFQKPASYKKKQKTKKQQMQVTGLLAIREKKV